MLNSIEEKSTYFLDTNICTYVINNKSEHRSIVDRLSKINNNFIKIPSVVVAEFYYGLKRGCERGDYSIEIFESKIANVEKFIAAFEIIDFDYDCAIEYANIRSYLEKQGKPISNNDYLIASIVLKYNAILVTNDKDFENIKKLKCENWLN